MPKYICWVCETFGTQRITIAMNCMRNDKTGKKEEDKFVQYVIEMVQH